jgi:hypothetical protein
MMYHMHSKQASFTTPLPSLVTNNVYHRKQSLVTKGIESMPSNTSSLNMRYVFEMVRFSGWTPPKQHRASPLSSYFFLNVKSELIHPAPTRAAALDQAIYDCMFCGFTSNICPTGSTIRALSYNLVERLRLCDGACKARFAVRGRTLKLFTAGAVKSLHGSFDFYWGKKSSRILVLLSQTENRISHFCAGAQSFLCSAGAEHSSKKTSRLNALRVAERNFT